MPDSMPESAGTNGVPAGASEVADASHDASASCNADASQDSEGRSSSPVDMAREFPPVEPTHCAAELADAGQESVLAGVVPLVLAHSELSSTGSVPASSSVGRPRDPGIEERALMCALEIYARLGWSGFTIGKVAKRGHMGKSSLYLRWPTKEDILLDAFNATDAFFQRHEAELGDIPFIERMLRIAEHRVRTYYTPVGQAVIRLNLENQMLPEAVGELWRKSVGGAVMRTRHLIQAGIDNGDLRPETNLVQLGDALEGGMTMHVLATPTELRDRAIARLDIYSNELVAGTLGPWLTEQALRDVERRGSQRAVALLPLIALARPTQ
ncbi:MULTISPECIES: TetR/AcrR family transcriptional regulator [unclassified Actinobaculum]|uniref:TetR/AcrR family transcriptional regulator n=1 Tax=unclassified Actinobaculum TaxID=2609299 RepID=UPI000D527A97|nr:MULTISPECIES: TetR/AcrR family transcriptional regulator [unclassified Actinobaculum]AWE43101.1 hypothetical protein DDD63_10520 [Actinobaculum sp. 313]RTE48514.1 TetR/AcrR family transcriptional regulator [Actinobaculum sp. 352]